MAEEPQTDFGQIEDVDTSARQFIWGKYKVRTIILASISILITGFIIFGFIQTGDPNVLKALGIPIVIFGIGFASIYNKAREAFFKQFAAKNNYSYVEKGDVSTVISRHLEVIGHSQYLTDIISGTYNNFPLRLFNFNATIGYGKNSYRVDFTVFEMQFVGDVLDIIIDRAQKSFFNSEGQVSSYSGMHTLSLEGDFDKHFKVLIPDGYQIEALEILTPDVMQELIDNASKFSFEFKSNKLYIFAEEEITKRIDLETMYDFSKTITTKLMPVLATLKTDKA